MGSPQGLNIWNTFYQNDLPTKYYHMAIFEYEWCIKISEDTNVRRGTETPSHQTMLTLMNFKKHQKLSSLKWITLKAPQKRWISSWMVMRKTETWNTEGKAQKFLSEHFKLAPNELRWKERIETSLSRQRADQGCGCQMPKSRKKSLKGPRLWREQSCLSMRTLLRRCAYGSTAMEERIIYLKYERVFRDTDETHLLLCCLGTIGWLT